MGDDHNPPRNVATPVQDTEDVSGLASPLSTPWGSIAAVLLSLLPILLLLLFTLVKRISLPSSTSLPAAAALLAFIRLAYLGSEPLLVTASVLKGVLEALTPLSVIYGAILLFETMQHTKCLPWMMHQVKKLSAGEPIAEVFLIGWSFAFMISGVGGFNTPIALAAPMLASLGHDPVKSIIAVVIFSTLASHYGSVGLSIWFGMKSLGLGQANLLLVGLKASTFLAGISFLIGPVAASYLIGWRRVARSGVFVMLSTGSAVVPMVLLARASTEFPVLVGGLCGIICTAVLAYFKVGISSCSRPDAALDNVPLKPQRTPSWHWLWQFLLKNSTPVSVVIPDGIVCISDVEMPDLSKLPMHHNAEQRKEEQEISASEDGIVTAEVRVSTSDSVSSLNAALARRSCPAGCLPLGCKGQPVQQHHTDTLLQLSTSHDNAAPHATSIPAGSENSCNAANDLPANLQAALCAATIHHAALSGISRQPWHSYQGSLAIGLPRWQQLQQWQQWQQQQGQPVAIHVAALHLNLEGEAPPGGTEIPAIEVPDQSVHSSDSSSDGLQDSPRHVRDVTESVCGFQETPNEKQEQQQQQSCSIEVGPDIKQKHTTAVKALQRLRKAVLRTLPLWLTLLLLVITRVQSFKIQAVLRSTTPSIEVKLGTLGSLQLSPSLVLQLQQLLSVHDLSWKYEVLYVPCLVPFVVAGLATIMVHRRQLQKQNMGWQKPFILAWQKLQSTVAAMIGAMILSQLISAGGTDSPAYIIGYYLSSWLGRGYLAIAGFIGALGTFISGSTMTANLTFGAVQQVAAANMGVPVTTVLAVHVVGSCAGKMMCISNILSVKAMMDLQHMDESKLMRKLIPTVIVYVLIAQTAGAAFALSGAWPDS